MDINKKHQFIDLTELISIVGDDIDTVKVLCEEFIETTPEEISILNEVINSSNFERIAEAAHKLKATFKYFGLSSTPDLINIELGAKKGIPIEEIKNLLESVNKDFPKALEEIKQLIV